jgi:S-methylmethionine-dependent homocysteine/selenocysteine methylase
MPPPPLLLLDGGMGRQLQAMGAPFRQPEWSALALIEAPHTVQAAHAAFLEAGARVVTTNSYALVPFHLGKARFAAGARACVRTYVYVRSCVMFSLTHARARALCCSPDAAALADLSGKLARAAVDAAAAADGGGVGRALVAASLPPTCGSYAADAFDAAAAARVLGVLVPALSPHADVWLAETLGSTAEARAADAAVRAAHAAGNDPRPRWFSFCLKPGAAAGDAAPPLPCLLSGESVAQAAAAAHALRADALLFNCAPPELMAAALSAARAALASLASADDADACARVMRLGAYANAFEADAPEADAAPANAALRALRRDVTPAVYAAHAAGWAAGSGASILGGCCGVGPAHIAALRDTLRPA